MPTRITKFRQRNVISTTPLATPTLQTGEVARVIINYLQIKMTDTSSSLGWKNLWAHLYLVPNGHGSLPFAWPEPAASLVPVASLVMHTITGGGVTFRIPEAITLRGGPNSIGFDTTGSINSKFLIDSDADFLSSNVGDIIRNRTIFSGSGHVTGSGTSSGVFMRWNVPEHFYMSPGDSLAIHVGGWTHPDWQNDTNPIYFLGTDMDLVYVVDSN
jgi:hypothetical protein